MSRADTRKQEKAAQAAGVGETEQDEQASDRDADGRRLWEKPATSDQQPADEESPPQTDRPAGRDPHGQCGQHLDLQG